ncbi:MAG: DUF3108 domain-containing protein [Bacteroidetes bacterium CG02_land_8_20_14_3_00_31_25]|nr:DUF3108 domain-containing protein [Bacteroidota bacterium]PIV63109.1 MAG: DUF3108 domain-containing protein [Bacteroidetes bacterium CG02_land_8_20_14_3_00_31_25]PIX35564.1 MAG: DUF3108 domain-containing protein [Bacteroidetes bacterium CG_4_8_14_3_um_filter_31_14]PIY02915.1 MAG: DUF3108 domain-containing protein [Bacteroidetes bacterium CG_4_10_14_3_um_filter_31_20]
MTKYFVFFILFLSIKLALSQSFLEKCSFKSGERISYNIMYNLGFIWVNAGKVDFSVDSSQFQNKPVYIFKSAGTSYSSYDWIMKVREAFSSTAECKNLKPLKYIRKSIEGSYFASEIYEFDYIKNKLYTQIENSKTKLTCDTFVLKNNALDLLTAIYVCRNIDFSKYKIEDKIPFLILLDNKYEPLGIKYLGTEKIQNRDGKQFNCLKFSATVVAGTIFRKGENMKIWVTNDKNHLPVYIEANILVGTVKAFITSWSGL